MTLARAGLARDKAGWRLPAGPQGRIRAAADLGTTV